MNIMHNATLGDMTHNIKGSSIINCDVVCADVVIMVPVGSVIMYLYYYASSPCIQVHTCIIQYIH